MDAEIQLATSDVTGVSTAQAVPALQLLHVSKAFGPHLALNDVDLEVGEGEVVGLLGENGSGKSTLAKVLSGYHAAEPGAEIRLGGELVPLPSSDRHRDRGLSFVYQDLGLALDRSVVENLFAARRRVGHQPRTGWINWRKERAEAQRLLRAYGIELSVAAKVVDLTLTERALIAIVRALEEISIFRSQSSGPGVLVLDEPTVFLPLDGKKFLYELVRKVTQQGTGVIFISHDLVSVRELATRAVILRDGHVAGNVVLKATSDRELIELMSAARATATITPAAAAKGERESDTSSYDLTPSSTRLDVRNLTGGRLQDVSLTLSSGEIVGVAGILGSGAEDLPYALFGLLGTISGFGRYGAWQGPLSSMTPRLAIQSGLALVPADRQLHGVAHNLSLERNMFSLVLGEYSRCGVLSLRSIHRAAASRCERYSIRPNRPALEIAALSGGNQQKVVLAKWLELGPKVLLLHEPSQGVDVATRAEIHALMKGLANAGTAILWSTTDLDELASVSHRVVIMRDGFVEKEFRGSPLVSADMIRSGVYGTRTTRETGEHSR
ncbi:MAG: sugar ABC transporter ATP-binding protein [Actinomycetota bacterium]|nr:sugar ABC transporter ATP-binding protein [Actinomycetota bacterium]